MEKLSISKFNRRFLLIDLLLCSLWALFVFRIWSGNVMTAFCVRENLIDWWTVPFVLYVVMLRLRVSIMMYRNDKHGLWASLLLIPASIVSSNNNVKRLDLLEVKYNLTGVMKVKNSLGHIGLRDLYRMIIPAEYSDIQDYE